MSSQTEFSFEMGDYERRPSTSAKCFKKVAKALVNCPQALDFVDISLRFDPELVKVRSAAGWGDFFRELVDSSRESDTRFRDDLT